MAAASTSRDLQSHPVHPNSSCSREQNKTVPLPAGQLLDFGVGHVSLESKVRQVLYYL
jgi:hypothetical protein